MDCVSFLKAVVLAAGAGTRMWPLATTKPKHLLPIAGKPLIANTLQALSDCGITEVFVIIGFKGDLIQATLGNGASYGVHVEYLHQTEWTGTASALMVARKAVAGDPFLAMYGDLWVNASGIRSVVEKSRECPRVIGVVRMANPTEFGVIELDKDKLRSVHEKPKTRMSEGWVNTGIYVLDDTVFNAIAKTSPSTRKEYELTSSLQRLVDEGEEIRGAMVEHEDWMDLGRPWDLLEANERSLIDLSHRINGTVEPGATLKGPVWLEEGASIKSGCYIEGPVYIGKGSKVGPNSRLRPCTSVGDEAIVGAACEIKNSIIMNGTKIPHLSYIGDSIIGEDCNIAAGTITANIRLDERIISVRVKGRLQATGRRKLGVIMGDGVQTGINASIMPGVRVGSGSFIGPGIVVYKDVPEGYMVFGKQVTVSKRMKARREGKKHG
jgi:bifunctional UDP-N-acetylglucosamine pyrophosphorylase/glucosamine-1-phosphate N-acetyltransferase